MAANSNNAISIKNFRAGSCVCVTAVTDLDDAPGAGIQLLFTAGGEGSELYSITAIPRANIAATGLMLFRDGDGTGTAKRLFNSNEMELLVISTGALIPTVDFLYSEDNSLKLAAGEKIYAGIGVSVAGGIAFHCEGGDL